MHISRQSFIRQASLSVTQLGLKCVQACGAVACQMYHFYARKQNASRVLVIIWASVRLFDCPSVTLVGFVKTVQARITKSSLLAVPRSLVQHKISCHWVQGFPSNEGVKEGYPLKRHRFVVIGSNNVITVAVEYTYMLLIITSAGESLFGSINISGLELPSNPQKEVFS